MRSLTVLSIAALLIGLASCGPGNGLNLARVRGTVTLEGEPLKNGTVMFEPDESKGTTGPQAVGTIMPDGTFIMSSQSAGDGAVVGFHRVGILGLDESPSLVEPMPDVEEDPLAYLAAKDAAVSKSIRQNAKGGQATVSGLDGKSFRVLVPEQVTSTSTSGIVVEVTRGSNTIHLNIKEDGSVETN